MRWVLVDVAPAVLPELGPQLGAHALGVLRKRGVDVRLGTSVVSADDGGVVLTDGTDIRARTLIWGPASSPARSCCGWGCRPTGAG